MDKNVVEMIKNVNELEKQMTKSLVAYVDGKLELIKNSCPASEIDLGFVRMEAIGLFEAYFLKVQEVMEITWEDDAYKSLQDEVK